MIHLSAIFTILLIAPIQCTTASNEPAEKNCSCETAPNDTNAVVNDTVTGSTCVLKPTGKQFCPQPSETKSPPNCIPFPDLPFTPPPEKVIYTTSAQHSPTSQCRSCGMKLTSNGSAVILHCVQCFEQTTSKQRRRSQD